MAHLERRRIIHTRYLFLDRLDDRRAAMAGIHAPQPRGRIEDLPAVDGCVVHVLGADENSRGAFLNWRFAVNGIQNGSRSFGTVPALVALFAKSWRCSGR